MGSERSDARVIAGRYRLHAALGRGGMSVVWRATDQLLGREVAVKELAPDDAPPVTRVRSRGTARCGRRVRWRSCGTRTSVSCTTSSSTTNASTSSWS
ncbi:hypothetical protein GCM10020295_31750 [Streptomyces cinereospinus]